MQTESYIKPEVLAALRNLQLVAKSVVDGFMIGAHKSPVPGAGVEFNRYRSYQPGDSLKQIDWKLYARSDRYYIREAETETSITVRIILDCSASMRHTENAVSKFDYARFLAASLAWLSNSQGDAIGLHLVSDAVNVHLPASRNPQHLHHLLHALETTTPEGNWVGWPALETILTSSGDREVLVFITDLHEPNEEISKNIIHAGALGHDVILMQLYAPLEQSFEYAGATTFEDLESGQQITVDPAKIKKQVQENRRDSLKQRRHELENNGIHFAAISIAEPLDAALRDFLRRRTHGAAQ